MPFVYDEVVHNHYGLKMDMFRDVDNITSKDQRIDYEDYKAIIIHDEQKKLAIIKAKLLPHKPQLFDLI